MTDPEPASQWTLDSRMLRAGQVTARMESRRHRAQVDHPVRDDVGMFDIGSEANLTSGIMYTGLDIFLRTGQSF